MSNSITGGLADLAARKRAAARVVYAKAVAGQAVGRAFTDAELDEVAAALALLNVPAATADEDAALYAGLPALTAAVAALPAAEQMAAEKAKLIEELTAAEGEVVVATRMNRQSTQMLNDLQGLRVRVNRFGYAGELQRRRLHEVTARLAPVLAVCPIAPPTPVPIPADDNTAPTKARKATPAK